MRFSLLQLLCLCIAFQIHAQAPQNDKLKLSIAFGNSVKLAYDAVDRKHNFDTDIVAKIENGDHHFYNAHYKRCVDYYLDALELLVTPSEDDGAYFDVFKRAQRKDKRFTKGEKLLKLIGKQSLSKEQSLHLASSVNNLGIYHHQVGNFRVAEKFILKSLELRGIHAGKTSEAYNSSLHNLALLRKDQGRYDAAADMLKYLEKYFSKTRSKSSHQYAITVNNQAMLNASLGRVAEATNLLEGLLASEVSFPPHSLDKARMTVNLALLYIELENFNKAETLLKSAINIYEVSNNKKLPDYAEIQLYLGEVYLNIGKTALLNNLLEDNLRELGKDLGTSSLAYLKALETKGDYFLAIQDFDQAAITYDEVSKGRSLRLGVLHQEHLMVQTKLAVSIWKNGNLSEAHSILAKTKDRYLRVVDSYFYAMSEHEKTKFWEMLKPELDVFYSFAVQNHNKFENLLQEAYDLRLKTKGLLLHSSNEIRASLQAKSDDGLTKKFNDWIDLKKTISGYYGIQDESTEVSGLDLEALELQANELEKEINRSLPQGQNTIYRNTTLADVQSKLNETQAAIEIIRVNHPLEETTEYVSLVATENGLTLVQIGEAVNLDSKMASYYHNVIKAKISESLASDKFWKPIAASLQGIDQVFMSLDGVYNLININSLHDGSAYVIDKLEVDIVPNTSALVANNNINSNEQIVLLGNPVFEQGIDPLPGTAEEILEIQKLFSSQPIDVLGEEKATESALKKVSKPKILHIATHGFFKKDKVRFKKGQRSVVRSNPLLKSGLLLSANSGTKRKKDDGVFTSYDAMNLNLQHTDLVVLSACETGKGEVVNGEGVYGLSRAFTIAGARNLIMSLWKVDDNATRELMINFYRQWQKSQDLKGAFRTAQLQLKEKYKDPYYWAAFVLVSN